MHECLVVQSRPTLSTPWTAACHAPLSMGLSRQEYWSGLPCLPPGDPPNPGSSSFSILSFCLFMLFMGFSRQEYWSGLPFPSPVDHILSDTLFQQHKRRLYKWISPDGQHRNQIDYILCSQRWRSSIQSTKTRPGADCGSDHELLTARFRLKLKKVGKTTRQFSYDLNQIPYDYTVEVRNRLKGLYLIDTVLDELWTEVRDIV